MDLSLILEYAPLLLAGLKITVLTCLGALAIGLSLGLVLYPLSQSKSRPLRLFYRLYVTVFRGTPLLVQVYLLFYGGPLLGLTLGAIEVGIWGMGFYVSAYFAEIYRAGFASLAKGQMEAAYDLGFSPLQTLRKVQLPQMLGLIIPPITNQSIILIKESAILSIITVPEISTAAIRMATETFSVVEPYLVLALAYWLLTTAVSAAGQKAEQRATHYLNPNVRNAA
ncbi:amino acid ABC transporter permease [Vibrio sp. WXL103]|uniref:amino acid ABC transporter permease n=1 Tax=unclassified Vibrio TaxID=2614977 RepID=UPI003EC4F832